MLTTLFKGARQRIQMGQVYNIIQHIFKIHFITVACISVTNAKTARYGYGSYNRGTVGNGVFYSIREKGYKEDK
jgi:hypothetical protein